MCSNRRWNLGIQNSHLASWMFFSLSQTFYVKTIFLIQCIVQELQNVFESAFEFGGLELLSYFVDVFSLNQTFLVRTIILIKCIVQELQNVFEFEGLELPSCFPWLFFAKTKIFDHNKFSADPTIIGPATNDCGRYFLFFLIFLIFLTSK